MQTVGFKLSQPPKGETQFIEKGIDSQGKRERVRIYNFICPDDRGEVFDRWLLQDAGVSVRESVSSCEQMDHENPIDIYKDFSDPYFTDPYSTRGKTPQIVQEEASTTIEQLKLAIRGAVRQLKDAGQKITQTAIAQITGYSQQYISRFKVLLQTLLESLYSKSSKNNEPPTEDGEVEWVGQEYLPIIAESPPNELLEELLTLFESYGAAVWRQIWDTTPAAVQIKIFQVLMLTLTPGELRSLSITTEAKI